MIFLSIAVIGSCQYDNAAPGTGGNNGGNTGGNGGNTGGNGENLDPCSPDSVYFNKDILPILLSNCTMSGCHDVASHQDGVILTDYAHAVKEVRPFKLSNSDLYKNITETDPDDRMPPPPMAPLSQDKISLIAKWINQGAQNLTCTESGNCDVNNVTYSGTIKPLLENNCIGCHGGSTPQGGINLSTHTSVQILAKNGRLHGTISWAPGYSPMPLGGQKLSQCNIDKVKAWVDAGALNN